MIELKIEHVELIIKFLIFLNFDISNGPKTIDTARKSTFKINLKLKI